MKRYSKNKKLANGSPIVLVLSSAVGTFVGIGIVLLILLDAVIMPAYIHSNPIVEVPNLIGRPLAEAESLLQHYTLIPVVTASYYSETHPEGSIIRQLPYPHTQVKEGRKIYLTISRGPMVLEMPYLVNLSLAQAKARLLQMGLEIDSLRFVAVDSVGADTVIAQNIPPSFPVHPDSTIILTVSLGYGTIVPSVVGLSKIEAEKQLVYHQLRIGTLHYRPDQTFLPGTVIEQSPPAGDTVQPYTPVSLVIAVAP